MLMSLYFQPGKDAMEDPKFVKEFVAKFFVDRPNKDENYLFVLDE